MLFSSKFHITQCVNPFIGWLKSSNVIAMVFALGDRFSITNSGDISSPYPVYSGRNYPWVSMPLHLNLSILATIALFPFLIITPIVNQYILEMYNFQLYIPFPLA